MLGFRGHFLSVVERPTNGEKSILALKTHVEAELEIFGHIEGSYNPHRRNSAIDCPSSAAFKREARASQTNIVSYTKAGQLHVPLRIAADYASPSFDHALCLAY